MLPPPVTVGPSTAAVMGRGERHIFHSLICSTTLKLPTKQSHCLMITSRYVILCFFIIELLKTMCFHFLFFIKKDNS